MMTSTPALSTSVAAIFFAVLKLDLQSMGTGIKSRNMSVDTLETNDTHKIGFEIAA
jgi:hypothetical protein